MTSGEILANSVRGILGAHNDDEKSVKMLVDDLRRNYEESKQRELELMARVERFERVAALFDTDATAAEIVDNLVDVANETPQQSLAEHDAEVVLKFAARLLSKHKIDVIDGAKSDANQLRQQADKQ